MKMMKTILIGIILMGHALASSAQEAKFKALFIGKFAEYISWPDGSKNVTIGVVGSTPVYDELVKYAGSKSTLNVIQLKSTGEVSKCKIVFIPETSNASIGGYKDAIGNSSILLVADEESVVGIGSDISFYLEGNKLRFVVSEANIKKKNMSADSKLLALGKTI